MMRVAECTRCPSGTEKSRIPVVAAADMIEMQFHTGKPRAPRESRGQRAREIEWTHFAVPLTIRR